MSISADTLRVIQAILPVVEGTAWWEKRADVAWYVGRCIAAGFCKTDDQMRLGASRYMSGKKKVTPPGAKRKKEAEKERRRLEKSIPVELAAALDEAVQSDAARQYMAGNAKALNAVVGMVVRRYKADPAFVRGQITKRLQYEQGRDATENGA